MGRLAGMKDQMNPKSWKSRFAVAMMTITGFAVPALASGEGESPSLFTGDLGNIFWTLLTFVVVLVVLGRFAWGPILGALKKREDFIRESLEQAKKEREDSEAKHREYNEKLAAARAEATAIVEEGRRDAEAVRHQIEADTRNETSATIERAKREIGIATDTAVKELYELTGKLATEIASRLIRKELDQREHERLIAESIEELSKVERN